jgi:hypothetical protein
VKNIIDFPAGRAAGVTIADIAFDELDLRSEGLEVFFLPGREIIQHPDLMAAAHQPLGEMRADKPSASGYQI